MKVQNGRGFEQGTDGGDAAATMSCGDVAAVSPPSHPFLRWCAETLTKQLVNSRQGAPLLQCRKWQNVLHGYGLVGVGLTEPSGYKRLWLKRAGHAVCIWA